MLQPRFALIALLGIVAGSASLYAAEVSTVNDTPGGPGEWGFHPVEGEVSPVNPPAFVWRPQSGATSYEIQVARTPAFRPLLRLAVGLRYNCFCPPEALEAGTWHWRYRFTGGQGRPSAWSRTRSFVVDASSAVFPMPPREELIGRIPKRHPRLFVRPEQLPRLRELARAVLKEEWEAVLADCDRLMEDPPPTKEPPKYPAGMERKSEAWRKIWWGNRVYTIECLNGAATLGFGRLLSGRDDYGRLAKRLLLAAAEWDPKGATGYRYNDEAGMPYAYHFARTYTFINDLLTDEERARCRAVMAVRGREMYDHLSRRHIWRPYSSHSNRAWHFLGEVGIAFLDEVPDAEEWTWFAMNVFYCVYPVWSDADGGWHEGVSYWRSYINRFTWWADLMRVAMDVDAYRKPYFSQVGYYPLYLQPPGTRGGGFGDLCANKTSRHNVDLMTTLAAQARDPHWQWYVDVQGGPRTEEGYIGFIRGALPEVRAEPPADLPTSRCFRGTGQAVLNTTLLDASENVEVIFKSSPFGTQSHGYESNNSFLLYAFGERLLIRSGRRDIYGSDHHRNWMWHTKSTNCITAGGRGQKKHSAAARGRILAFHTSDAFDYVAGEAGDAYEDNALERSTRHILFVKPDLVIVFDRLEAPQATPLEYRLHAPTPIEVESQEDIRLKNGKAAARVSLLAPEKLDVSVTDEFDPPPRPRIKLTEWHLTAKAAPAKRTEFVTVIRVHRAGTKAPAAVEFEAVRGGYELRAALPDGQVRILLGAADTGRVGGADLQADGDVVAIRYDAHGGPTAHLIVRGRTVRAGVGPLSKE